MAKIRLNWPFIIGVVIFLVVASGGMLVYTMSNQFCGTTCHSMKSYYTTWQVSTHGPQVRGDKAVPCEACHYGEGVGGFVKAKIGGMKSMIKEVTANYHTPIKGEPFEEKCKECHDIKKIEGTDKQKIPHELHEGMGLKCMSCHGGLIHGFEGEGEAKVSHEACKQCHDTDNQDECTKCHKW